MAIVYPNTYKDYKDYESKSGYGEIDAYLKKNRQNTIDSIRQGLDRNIRDTNSSYAEAGRQAYLSAALAKKNLDEQIAKSGYTGGTADSFRLKNDAALQETLREYQKQKQSELSGLMTAADSAERDADSAYNSAVSSIKNQLASMYGTAKENENSRAQSDYWSKRSEDTAAEQAAYSRAWSEAAQRAEYGDFSGLRALGVDTSAAEAQYKADAAQTASERAWNEAAQRAKYGDYSGLKALGVDTPNAYTPNAGTSTADTQYQYDSGSDDGYSAVYGSSSAAASAAGMTLSAYKSYLNTVNDDYGIGNKSEKLGNDTYYSIPGYPRKVKKDLLENGIANGTFKLIYDKESGLKVVIA